MKQRERYLLVSLPWMLSALCVCAAAWAGAPSWYDESEDDPPAAVAARANPQARSAGGVFDRNGYRSVQVNIDAAGMNIVGDAANEPSIAVNPANPDHLVIGFRQFDSVTSNFRQAGWAYSHDRGQTWTFPGVLEPGVFRSDPVLDAGAGGRFYYQSLYDPPDVLFRNDVWRSDDGGLSWSSPVDAFGGDKNWMLVDRTGSGFGGDRIYTTWASECLDCDIHCCGTPGACCGPGLCCDPNVCCKSDLFSRSFDSGSSYDGPHQVGNSFEERPFAQTMAVDADGRFYLAGITFRQLGSPDRDYTVFRSDNVDQPLGSPAFDVSDVDLGGDMPTFPFAPNPGGLAGQVWVAADHSDRDTRGNVYVLATVAPTGGGDPSDIHLIRSEDGGSTWSTPVRIHDDPPGNGVHQWFGTLSVAPNGRLDAVWNDGRNAGILATFTELFYAYSYDGGRTWSPSLPVSPGFDSSLGYPNQNKLGDYYTLVSDEAGAAVAYAATMNGEQDVYFLRVFPDCNGNGASDIEDIAGGISFDVDGSRVPDECQGVVLSEPSPGTAGASNHFEVAGQLTAGSQVRIYQSRERGGPTAVEECPGLTLDLSEAKFLAQGEVKETGGFASISIALPGRWRGQTRHFQAVDVKDCRASQVVGFAFP